MFKNNATWQMFEKLKKQLRDAGCTHMSNEIYKLQLALEAKLTKELLCKKN